MKALDLKGRYPMDLPDRDTLDDILLDLVDTGKFKIEFCDIAPDYPKYSEYAGYGGVVVYNADYSGFNPDNNVQNIGIKTTSYVVSRSPMRINVGIKTGELYNIYSTSSELIDLAESVYIRIIEYLGVDIIQSQFFGSFTIDFISSDVK